MARSDGEWWLEGAPIQYESLRDPPPRGVARVTAFLDHGPPSLANVVESAIALVVFGAAVVLVQGADRLGPTTAVEWAVTALCVLAALAPGATERRRPLLAAAIFVCPAATFGAFGAIAPVLAVCVLGEILVLARARSAQPSG